MKKVIAFALLGIALPIGAQQTKPFDFSIRNIMRGPELYGRQPNDVRWSADSKWIYFTWLEPGSDWRETPKQFRVRAIPGSKPERVSIQQVDSTGSRFARGDRSHNGRYSAVEFNGDLYINDLTTGTTRRLTQTVEQERNPQFSSDDRQIFFVRNNNIYSIDLAGCLLRVRTKVGDTEQRGRLAIIALPSANVTWLKPFPADTTTGSFALLGWNEAGTRALIVAFSDDNKMRFLDAVDPSAKLTTLESLRDTAWVGGPCSDCAGWYGTGSGRVWYASEADGYPHLYTIAPDGTGRQQLTRGRWEVRDVALSPDRRWFYLTTNEVSPFEQHLYRMPVTGGAMEKITTKVGKHTAVVSPDGQLVADVYSYVNRPPDLFLLRDRAGAEMSQLTLSPSGEGLSFACTTPQIVMIPASDGIQVPAHIYKPSDMKAEPNGAAVIFVHGAGYLHNVGDFWSEYPREYMFNQFLASKGYTVLDLDYRGSDGYGRDWRTAIYRHMGGRDLQDQVDASKYLVQTIHVDSKRIGIYGGSYGGFITLMALFTESPHFGAGAALRSVTDWAHYNQGYTSNILNLPQNDTLAYRQSSPIYFAEGLQDPLLMAHGMSDTNVHFQDIVRLTQRFIELGKTRWELAVYPVEDHAFVRPSSWADEYRRIFELFERYLPARTSNK